MKNSQIKAYNAIDFMFKVAFHIFNKSEILFFSDYFKKVFPKSLFEFNPSNLIGFDVSIINCTKSDWTVFNTLKTLAENKQPFVLFSIHEPDLFFLYELFKSQQLYSSCCHLLICPEDSIEMVMCAEFVFSKKTSFITKKALALKKYIIDYKPFDFESLSEIDRQILFRLVHEKMIKEIGADLNKDPHYVEKRISAIKQRFPDLAYPQFRHALLNWFAGR